MTGAAIYGAPTNNDSEGAAKSIVRRWRVTFPLMDKINAIRRLRMRTPRNRTTIVNRLCRRSMTPQRSAFVAALTTARAAVASVASAIASHVEAERSCISRRLASAVFSAASRCTAAFAR